MRNAIRSCFYDLQVAEAARLMVVELRLGARFYAIFISISLVSLLMQQRSHAGAGQWIWRGRLW